MEFLNLLSACESRSLDSSPREDVRFLPLFPLTGVLLLLLYMISLFFSYTSWLFIALHSSSLVFLLFLSFSLSNLSGFFVSLSLLFFFQSFARRSFFLPVVYSPLRSLRAHVNIIRCTCSPVLAHAFPFIKKYALQHTYQSTT